MCGQTQTHTPHRVHVFISTTYTILSSSTQTQDCQSTSHSADPILFIKCEWKQNHDESVSIERPSLSLYHLNQIPVGYTDNQIWTDSVNTALTTVGLQENTNMSEKHQYLLEKCVNASVSENPLQEVIKRSCI